LVIFSIKFLPQSARLPPEVIEHGGLKDPSYWWAFGLSSFALVLLAGLLVWLRYRVGCAEEAQRAQVAEEYVYDT
jgi:hypothetical protein